MKPMKPKTTCMKRILTLGAVTGVLALSCFLLRAQNEPICQPPVITTQPASQTRTQYQNVSFSVAIAPAATTPVSYQWRANGVNLVDGDRISAAATPTLTIFELTPSDAGDYTVVVSNSCVNGVVTSSNAHLAVDAVNPTDNPDGDDANNLTELLRGRNHLAAQGTVPDSGNHINLQVFTPLE